ncbi:glycogen/starch/alpha-glucan phosphorylase [Aceticella autotrophica]|uniref:Alpha-1,4 glucan phosphorylase n=1 Tax=Aceticella autotrophica TaxID=2755338 RepID=A0A975AWJ9_9THEO|nr:glycogen/starch/alpha-glucan phosphorylase [Aceticella autotrophica]QSZ27711.1 glycogen/starch/alpha-glucan phosphorylase [Aceticella autotrophica]
MLIKKEDLKKDFKDNLITLYAEDVSEASLEHKYFALSEVIKKYMFENWMKTNRNYSKNEVRQVYYFSIEFLLGRILESNLINLGIRDLCKEALSEMGINLDELCVIEKDAGLGNGGLGRLAACFLDSMASLSIPGHGNGIRYRYGFFDQKIMDGYQIEIPDNWLKDGYVWEIRRNEKAVRVRFNGNVRMVNSNGRLRAIHENYETVLAVPYDIPIVGYDGSTVNTLRLWSAEPMEREFDFSSFSSGDYTKAVEYKYSVEAISQVLYPDDSSIQNKSLRLKQEYFFASAGIQSILRTYKKKGKPIEELYRYVAIHINDTHPSLVIPELMRILVDEENLTWEKAWDITTKVVSYTNHTIMSEALEKWPVSLMMSLLPRIYTIIEEINRRFYLEVKDKFNNNWDKINKVSIIQNGNIMMANLCVVGSRFVNGVSELHTEILKKQVLSDLYEIYPRKFKSVTNGITHRRWLLKINPELVELINDAIGSSWIKKPNSLIELKKYIKDKDFCHEIADVKLKNKIKLAKYIKEKNNIELNPKSIFDIQAKRFHAYKRQLLNIMHIMYLYNKLKENPNTDIIPRTFIFSGKAAPGYKLAKEIIKLINCVADKVNNDNSVNDVLKVVFLENYNVSLAEMIIPCAEVSEQISTASKEASGTSNMKFMMNGAITIGTLDGANVEIKEAVGDDNIVIFGLKAYEVLNYYKNGGYSAMEIYNNDMRIHQILDQLVNGFWCVKESGFIDIHEHLLKYNDEFFVLKDFDEYVKAQEKISRLYQDKIKWNEMSINNIANSGRFSSDNSIKKYAENIWNV